jgi:hypothetical protein
VLEGLSGGYQIQAFGPANYHEILQGHMLCEAEGSKRSRANAFGSDCRETGSNADQD